MEDISLCMFESYGVAMTAHLYDIDLTFYVFMHENDKKYMRYLHIVMSLMAYTLA